MSSVANANKFPEDVRRAAVAEYEESGLPLSTVAEKYKTTMLCMVCKPPNTTKNPIIQNSTIQIAEDESHIFQNTPASATSVKQIEIPGYSNLKIFEDCLIQLKNPQNNQVYLKYVISEADTVIYESDYITPGDSIAWPAGENVIGKGEHVLSMFINTLTMDTYEPKNTATILVKATVYE